jgi:hypothetical protein
VCIDEPGYEVGAGYIDPFAAFVMTEADDVAVGDGDIQLEPLFREHGEHAAAGQHKVGRLVTPRDRYPPCVDDGQA